MAENEADGEVGLCYLEVDRDIVTEKEMQTVEKLSNDAIREAVNVKIGIYQMGDPALEKVYPYFALNPS